MKKRLACLCFALVLSVLLCACAKPADQIPLKLSKAEKYADAGDFYNALKQYDQILEADEKNAAALYGSAHVFTLLGKPDDALTMLNSGIQVDPDNAKAHTAERMMLYKWTGDTDSYTGALADLVADQPRNKALKDELFGLYLDAENYDKARELDENAYFSAISALYEKNPDNKQFADELFTYYLYKGETDKALPLLDTIYPDHAKAIDKDLNILLNKLLVDRPANCESFAKAILSSNESDLTGLMLAAQSMLVQSRSDELIPLLSGQKKFADASVKESAPVYFGQYGEDGKPSGLGIGLFIVKDFKCVYVGQWENGIRAGYGYWIGDQEIYTYEGNWANDKPNGSGKILWENAECEGTFQDGIAQGNASYSMQGDDHVHVYYFTVEDGIVQIGYKDKSGYSYGAKCETCDYVLYLGGPYAIAGFFDNSLLDYYYLDPKGRKVYPD